MRLISVYLFLGWSQLFLCVEGARKEQTGTVVADLQPEKTGLRRNSKTTLTQVHMNADRSEAQIGTSSRVKASVSQDPSIPVHSLSGLTTTVPGHRPRAFVVAGILFILMVLVFAAIFATIHRKVSDEVTVFGHSRLPVPSARDIKTLRAEAPGDLRRVDDEIAELTKDLTPASSPEGVQPYPQADPEASAPSTTPPGRCVEAEKASLPTTPARDRFGEHLHPALGEAPLPTPPPRSPPKGNRRKRCTADPETPGKIDAPAAPSEPVSDLRNLDDEFAELARDLEAAPSEPVSDLRNLDDEFAELARDLEVRFPILQTPQISSSPLNSRFPISAQDFAEVKTLKVVSEGELRSHDDEFADLVQDLLPSSNRSANGELRSFEDEISELADDLHTQEPETQV